MSTGFPGVDLAVVWCGVVAAIGAALGLIYRATRSVRRLAERLGDVADDWQGVPARPGVPGRPGVMERLDAIEGKLGAVEHELHPNSGGSLRDAVDRVDERTRRTLDE
ncbi:hypothetical protein ACWGIN_20295 [Streptomyces sp. NPDC054861]